MNQILKESLVSTQDHCAYCFDVLITAVTAEDISSMAFPPLPSSMQDYEAPLFVSWHKHGKDLRGCIGTFTKGPISENLVKYTISSAFEDHRFDPISETEIPHLHCSVSFLTNFEKGKDAYDWEIGRHGIRIELDIEDDRYRATYLPEVAHSRGWSKDETLKHLLRKAGCDERLRDVIHLIRLERYQSSKCEISYEEYIIKSKKAKEGHS